MRRINTRVLAQGGCKPAFFIKTGVCAYASSTSSYQKRLLLRFSLLPKLL